MNCEHKFSACFQSVIVAVSLLFANVAYAANVDVPAYVPAASASGGYVSYLRVINKDSVSTSVTVTLIDGTSGLAGATGTLTASLPALAAMTYTAQQVEAALGVTLLAGDRPRIRVTASTLIEVQSFLSQPGGVFNEISDARGGTSAVTVRNYVPAAMASSGYVSYLRIVNTGTAATPVTVARVDPATGQTGAAGTLNASLPAGAAFTYSATQVEAALGSPIAAGERPRILVTGANSLLDVQTFLLQPGGVFSNHSSGQTGNTVDVRNYVPVATTGYTSYLRVINDGSVAAPVTVALLDESGAVSPAATLIASLPAGAAMTLTSSQVEAALGINIPAAARPRIRVSSSVMLGVQSFLLQPGGAFNEMSDASSGTSVDVRTYIPAADARSGYTSYLRVINTGIAATPVTVALVDGITGAVGSAGTLIASLPAGGASTLTPSQVEAALGTAIASGSRPRIRVSGNTVLEVQSYLMQPGGAFAEVSGGQSSSLSGFSVATVADPLARQQWGLLNTGQNGYADTAGVANTGGTLGTDINANPVYMTYGYTGRGVIVAVVDTGLEIAHEDLKANVVPGGSWDFINNTTDPTNATATTGDHGTMVSGLIAMAMNGIGGIGVAPNAQLKGFNFLSSTQTLAEAIVSLGGSTASPNSSDVFVFNQSFGTSSTVDYPINPTREAQYAYGTSTLRGGKGALYVKSAGNGFVGFGTAYCGGANALGVSCQNANFDPDNTLPYNIVMAALNAKGKRASYSSAGSAIWASAPGGEYGQNVAAMNALGVVSSNATGYDPGMVTTDQSGCTVGVSRNPPVAGVVANGGPYSYFNQGGTNLSSINASCNYTNAMNGTSSAAPMTSGAIALILEANPALTWRDVKHILARTAVQVDAANPGVNAILSNGNYVAELPWITNAAGFNFQNSYGFGAVNVSAAVAMAKGACAAGCGLGTFANTGWISSGTLNLAVPDNSITGVSTTLAAPKVGASGIVEAVQIQVTTSATSGWTGDLGIELTSPSGTRSILKNIKDGFNGPNLAGMVLASNAFYGESGTGIWTVKVLDGLAGSGIQTLTNVQIRVYGH